MVEWFWLIVLAALLAGWLIGRRIPGIALRQPDKGLSNGHVEGLNYLLNEQPDRAIDVLVSMVGVDSETVETHLALGTLFRNKGEVDRAIRIHQNLFARPTLTKSQRLQAQMNLGLDYKQAGLNDRAVTLFEQLALEAPPYQDRALENLLEIYQYEKEWLKAITVSSKLLTKGSARHAQLIGHFYGELIELAIEDNDWRRAEKMLRQMRGFAPRSPRYLLLQLKLARLRGRNRSALRWLDEIINQFPDYRLSILDDLEACYRESGAESQFLRRLNDIAGDSKSGFRLVCRIADIVQSRQGDEAARLLLEQQSNRLSATLLSAKILSLSDLGGGLSDGRKVTDLVNEMVAGLMTGSVDTRCKQCGFEARERHWRCPGCGTWESLEFQEAS